MLSTKANDRPRIFDRVGASAVSDFPVVAVVAYRQIADDVDSVISSGIFVTAVRIGGLIPIESHAPTAPRN